MSAAVAAGVVLSAWSVPAGLALVAGAVCGVANALLSMFGNERLADQRSVPIFAISSILRLCVFAIVPVEFALHGPPWTMAVYFIGFFTPLALYAFLVGRALRTG